MRKPVRLFLFLLCLVLLLGALPVHAEETFNAGTCRSTVPAPIDSKVCPHPSWGNWGWANSDTHVRYCAVCRFTERQPHKLVLTDNQNIVVCTDCGAMSDDWKVPQRQQTNYSYDSPGIDTTHRYHGVRGQNRTVVVVQPCAYFEMFEEAALDEDGVLAHDRWNWCIQCQNFQELDDTLCSAPMYCYGCTRVDIMPRSLTPAQHRLAIQRKNLLELHTDKLD